ncbi:hypothetical protein LG200_04185 [Methylobacillus caricis]|uniref:hypothetical protein n=1 Tax=Methylobacillus caricis TaxID=1971611 RepID=UPI001CFF938D|nr:hypothetical protein [Methylobacillus caricis]MCB5187203.1 hypothetical protein [Methylobacillus caricis]
MNSTRESNAPADSVWNYSAIARDFVVNVEPMSTKIKIEELSNLLKMVKHRAELSVLENLNLPTHELAVKARGEIKAVKNEITFHNHLSLHATDIDLEI